MPADSYQEFDLMGTGADFASDLLRFVRWLRRSDISLVHAHHRRLAMLANAVSRFTNVPVLYTAHNCFKWSPVFWLFGPRKATGVSSSVVQYLRRATRAKDPEVIWNPLRFGSIPEEERLSLDECARVVSIGRLEPVKGHLHLIRAWQILKHRGIRAHLTIIGEGYLRADLSKKIREYGLEEVVSLENYRSDIQDQIRASLFNVLVSATEGFPNVVVEAAAVGRASLVTNVDGSRDCIPSNAQLPNLVPFANPEALASCLASWLEEPAQTKTEGRRFYEFLKGRCDTNVVQKKYNDMYRKVAVDAEGSSLSLRH
jgi:glycosyltransferase involved in cell wall biosynthesis